MAIGQDAGNIWTINDDQDAFQRLLVTSLDIDSYTRIHLVKLGTKR
jgi:hypothetical protein